MKNISRYTAVFFVAGLFSLLFSCKKESVPEYNPNCQTTTVDLTLQVTGENGTVVSNANVAVGGKLGVTNEKGLITLYGCEVCNKNAFVRVYKNGFFDGSRSFIPTGNDNTINVRLIAKNSMGTVVSGTGGVVDLPTGGTVDFAANSLVRQDATSYSGDVNVFAHHLSPDTPEFYQKMPGSLIGFQSTSENGLEAGYIALKTFGMLILEPEDNNGQKLNLANDKKTTISLPIPTDILGSAPSSIALWYFDSTIGLWKQEGTASLLNGSYVASVSHFGWWSCAIPNNYIELGMKITLGGEYFPGVVVLNSLSLGSVYAAPDNLGKIIVAAPASESVEISIVDPCGNVVPVRSVGPFVSNTDLGDISVVLPSVQITDISGTVLGCDGFNLAEGIVFVEMEGQFYRTSISNGHYSLKLFPCDASAAVNIFVYNSVENLFSVPEALSIDGNNSYTVDLSGCSGWQSGQYYFNFTVDGIDYDLSDFLFYNSDLVNDITIFGGESIGSSTFAFLQIPTSLPAVGSYNLEYVTMGILTWHTSDSVQSGTVDVVEYIAPTPVVNGKISANYSGVVSDSIGTIHNFSGSFSIPIHY